MTELQGTVRKPDPESNSSPVCAHMARWPWCVRASRALLQKPVHTPCPAVIWGISYLTNVPLLKQIRAGKSNVRVKS